MDKKQLGRGVTGGSMKKALFEHFRTRDRNPKDGVMDLRRVKYALLNEGIEVVPEEFIDNFKQLERDGAGRLEYEDKKPVRFKWKTNMKRYAEEREPKVTKLVLKAEQPAAPKTAAKTGTKEVYLPLSGDREVTMSIPTGLTESEIQLIVKALRRSAL